MVFGESDDIWSKKEATLSDKTACKEYELTQQEIIDAIKQGKLQYCRNYVYGNPYLKLIRSEVEAFVNAKHGGNYLKQKKIKAEIAKITKDLKKLQKQIAALEKRKAELLASLNSETNA
jgi:hypothetical protein